MNFQKTIFENRQIINRPFLVAHRGVCGANIPPNTMASFAVALSQGADVIELDVSKSLDGVYYVFHPYMEPRYVNVGKYLWEMTSDEIDKIQLLNADGVKTSYHIPRLKDAFIFLKDKCYLNIDKFWTDIEGITQMIRECGIEKQVIVKTYTDEESLNKVIKYAPDFMFVPMVKKNDDVTETLLEKGINIVGVETLFDSEDDEVISDRYISKMHNKSLLIWVNSIVYNEEDVISAHHTDDFAVNGKPEYGWKWLIDKNIDFIQTDWLLALKYYMKNI